MSLVSPETFFPRKILKFRHKNAISHINSETLIYCKIFIPCPMKIICLTATVDILTKTAISAKTGRWPHSYPRLSPHTYIMKLIL